ncbi:MAG: VanZ family protein [Gammaproteobacteria bacterium]
MRMTRRARWMMAIGWSVVMVAVSDWPRRPDVVNESDKLVHIAAYGVLAFLVARAVNDYRRNRWQLWLAVLVGCVSFAGLDEFHQSFISYRSADIADWLADCIGVLIGSLACIAARPPDDHA